MWKLLLSDPCQLSKQEGERYCFVPTSLTGLTLNIYAKRFASSEAFISDFVVCC